MTRLLICPNCGGFVPPDSRTCPHCPGPGLARRLLMAAGAGAISITLMACYGAPAHYYQARDVAPRCDEDADGDGACAPVDCDDTDPSIHPQAADDAGDEIDQNCDGADGVVPETSVRAADPQ